MRIFSAAALALAGCGQASAPAVDNRIECALDGANAFARDCTLEPIPGGLIVRRPDGGFRRFTLDTDGGLSTADGAENARGARLADGGLEVAIGGDRYRLPR